MASSNSGAGGGRSPVDTNTVELRNKRDCQKWAISWCCENYCCLSIVLLCGYCSLPFEFFVLRHSVIATSAKPRNCLKVAWVNKAIIARSTKGRSTGYSSNVQISPSPVQNRPYRLSDYSKLKDIVLGTCSRQNTSPQPEAHNF